MFKTIGDLEVKYVAEGEGHPGPTRRAPELGAFGYVHQ